MDNSLLLTNKQELIECIFNCINSIQDRYQFSIDKVVLNDVPVYQDWTIQYFDHLSDKSNPVYICPYTTLDEVVLLEKVNELNSYIDRLPKPMKKILNKHGVKL